jgi:hypothetical protein
MDENIKEKCSKRLDLFLRLCHFFLCAWESIILARRKQENPFISLRLVMRRNAFVVFHVK